MLVLAMRFQDYRCGQQNSYRGKRSQRQKSNHENRHISSATYSRSKAAERQ